jgi:exodeoxyribonuclease V beta subunit
VEFENFLAYEASAGSGKTFNLVVRYLSLLFMGESPSSIVALTFTNKAANEMLERIILTLEELPIEGNCLKFPAYAVWMRRRCWRCVLKY